MIGVTTETTPTRRRGPRRTTRQVWPRLPLAGGLLFALVSYAGYQLNHLIFHASYFKLKRVEVQGTVTVRREEVLAYSGLELGMLAFRVDPPEVVRRVLLHPKISACTLEQPAPNELAILVQEKPVVARIDLDGRTYEVGPDGEIMAEAAADSKAPLLLDAEVEEGPPRRLGARHAARIRTWLPVLGAPPTQAFSRVRFGGGGRLDVYWQQIRLVVDDPERFERHRAFLGPILADARERGLEFEYVDLRFQDVVVRYRTPDATAPPTEPLQELPAVSAAPAPGPPPPPVGYGMPSAELERVLEAASAGYRAGPGSP